jgi:alpha-glucosidase
MNIGYNAVGLIHFWKGFLLVSILYNLTNVFANEDHLFVESPDSKVRVNINLKGGCAFYEVLKDNKLIIDESLLGFKFKNIPDLEDNFFIESSEASSFNQTWEQPWGEKRFIENNYNELIVNLRQNDALRRKLVLDFRVFNDGVGFKYLFPKQEHVDSLIISDEVTEFNFTAMHKAWWIPVHSENSFYESLYRHTPLNSVDTANTPVTIETNDGLFVAIHEADLTDYASMTLLRKDSLHFKCELVPWSNGVKVYGETPFQTPWRTIIITNSPGELITSHIMLNLNEPCRITDVSWIKPEKYIGIWWALHLGKYTWSPGPKHGANTYNTKMYIDFASENNMGGVLVEGWNLGWGDGNIENFITPYPDFDIQEICRYAKTKGVNLIGHHETHGGISNYERQIDSAFSMYQKLGINVVKTGYVSKYLDGKEWHDGQFAVRYYRSVIEKAAKYNILIDNHEPVKPTGISRTYPNLMTQEGARGQEYDAWSFDGGNPPSHPTILPFTRMLAGPMDFTFGTFNFENKNNPRSSVQTTLAKQLALYVVIYSPLQMASDLPENYMGNKAFEFIKKVPCDWDDTKVINGEIGNYITIARKDRNSKDWYLGSITNENSRNITLSLDFLEAGVKYTAEIYADGEGANWKTNPTAIYISSARVDANKKMKIKLAPGGGLAIRFFPIVK